MRSNTIVDRLVPVHPLHYRSAGDRHVLIRIHNLTASLSIWVYSDHAPPHFHLRSPNSDTLIDLRTLRILAGACDRRELATAVAWASEPVNLARLWAEWDRLNEQD